MNYCHFSNSNFSSNFTRIYSLLYNATCRFILQPLQKSYFNHFSSLPLIRNISYGNRLINVKTFCIGWLITRGSNPSITYFAEINHPVYEIIGCPTKLKSSFPNWMSDQDFSSLWYFIDSDTNLVLLFALG